MKKYILLCAAIAITSLQCGDRKNNSENSTSTHNQPSPQTRATIYSAMAQRLPRHQSNNMASKPQQAPTPPPAPRPHAPSQQSHSTPHPLSSTTLPSNLGRYPSRDTSPYNSHNGTPSSQNGMPSPIDLGPFDEPGTFQESPLNTPASTFLPWNQLSPEAAAQATCLKVHQLSVKQDESLRNQKALEKTCVTNFEDIKQQMFLINKNFATLFETMNGLSTFVQEGMNSMNTRIAALEHIYSIHKQDQKTNPSAK